MFRTTRRSKAWHYIIVGMLLTLPLFASSCDLALPPLLRGATASGGWYGACPPANESQAAAQAHGEAISPELDARLKEQFPPGTEESKIVRVLGEQGFAPSKECEGDHSIRYSQFRGHSVLANDVHAAVYWK